MGVGIANGQIARLGACAAYCFRLRHKIVQDGTGDRTHNDKTAAMPERYVTDFTTIIVGDAMLFETEGCAQPLCGAGGVAIAKDRHDRGGRNHNTLPYKRTKNVPKTKNR